MSLKKKYFDDDSFINFTSRVHLITNEADTHFKCYFYYNYSYTGQDIMYAKYYNGNKLVLVDSNERAYTLFDPGKNQKYPITGATDGVIVELNFLFRPNTLSKALLDSSKNISFKDTIINNVAYLAQINRLPDTEEYTNNYRIIFINKSSNLIERIYGVSHHYDQIQVEDYSFHNVQLKNFNLRFLDSLFQSNIKPDYLEKIYEPMKIDTLAIGTEIKHFKVRLYPEDKELPLTFKGKITVLDFWYTACLPCVQSIPHINNVYQKYKDKISFYAVNSSSVDLKNLSRIDNFNKRTPINYPVVLVDAEEIQPLKIQFFPTIYIIDSNGNLVFKHYGYNKGESFFDILDKALSELVE